MNTKFCEEEGLREEYQCLVYLVRHGESVGNLNKVVLGHTDLSLTDKGREQAALTADYLSEVDFCAIYSSDLKRAFETAAPHSKIHGLPIKTDMRLREMYFGDWENRAVAELIEEYGDMYWVDWRGGFGTFVPPSGEAVVDCAERIVGTLVDICEGKSGAILVTSHAAAIRSAWAKICGLEPGVWAERVEFPTNASFSVLGYRDGCFYPVAYSVDGHMGKLRTAIQTK